MADEYVTRKTLLQRASDPDDARAWEEFVGYYRNFILMLLRYMNVASADYDDLSQNILLRIWKKLDTYDSDRAKFRTWLSTIIRNEVFNYFERVVGPRKKQVDYREELLKNIPADEEFEKLVSREWAAYVSNIAMERVRQRFSGNAIQVFEMTLDGAGAEEIATKLGIEVFSVYALRRRVRLCLKEEIGSLRKELEL